MARKISIKNIADEVGVSIAAISLVLSGKDIEGRISKNVAEKIRTTAQALNYKPNSAARSLRTGKTKTLGLIVADISNPFFAKLARHIENKASELEYQVMFGNSDESPEKFSNLINLFIEKNVDGVIITPVIKSESKVMQLVNLDIPCVLIDRGFEGFPISSIQLDNVTAAFTLTNRMIDQGCKRIAFLVYCPELSNMQKRCEGYKKALNYNNIPYDDSIVRVATFNGFESNIPEIIDELLEKDIDCILFGTNRIGIHALLALRKKEKLNLFKYGSFDNPDEYRLSEIPIVCIEQPLVEIGKRALEVLFKKINNPEYDIVEHVILQANITR
jgi:LacI family transcriptional regulator